jgi:site-specific DNA recombinase
MRLVKIALYARVSSDKQAQEGTIDSQIEAIKEFIREKGGDVDSDLIFCDNGVSGATLIRPALEALRDKASSGEISQVYVLTPDRLARKYAHQLLLVEEFKKLNVGIIFVNKTISQTPEDQMLLQIQGVISEYEREKIMERSRRGKWHAAKKGKVNVLSGAPFGYVYIKASQEQNACYQIHPSESEIVKECFELYCNGMLSIGEIARKFTEKKYFTRTGKDSWDRSVIWQMLRNPAYMGQAAYLKSVWVPRIKPTKSARDNSLYPKQLNSSRRARPKGERINIPVPKIIDSSMFEQAERRLKENQKLQPRNNTKNEYLVSGLIRCNQCGYSMYGKRANTRYPHRYYRCLGQDGYRHSSGRICGATPVRVEVIDQLVWDATKRLIKSPELVMNEYANRIGKKRTNEGSRERLRDKKDSEFKQTQREKERMLDLYQSGILDLSEIEVRLKGIRSKLHRIQQEIDLLIKDSEIESRRLQVMQRFEDFCSTLTANLEELSFGDRKKVLRLLVTDVVVDTANGGISVNHILPLSQKSCPLRPSRHG